MTFYAHTAEDEEGRRLPEQHWQPLRDHLWNVACLAREFATPLGLAASAWAGDRSTPEEDEAWRDL